MANENPERRLMNTRNREFFFSILVVGLGIGAILFFSTTRPINFEPSLKGGRPPEIEFKLPHSQESAQISKLKGKVVLLNFWASWCKPCIEEMPSLQMLEIHFKEKGFLLLAFNIEDEGEQVRGRLEGINHPKNLVFNFNKDSLRPYDLRAIPVSVLIDSGGIVRQVYSGPRNWMDINIIREIETLLR